jgi:hypothetical protein
MASSKVTHIISSFNYKDRKGEKYQADIIVAERLDIVLITLIDRENVYSRKELDCTISIANKILQNYNVDSSKVMFFVRINEFTFKSIEEYFQSNGGDEKVFLFTFNNIGSEHKTWVEYVELSEAEVLNLYSLLEEEGIRFFKSLNQTDLLISTLTDINGKKFTFETEDYSEQRRLYSQIQENKPLPDIYFTASVIEKDGKYFSQLKSPTEKTILYLKHEDMDYFHAYFLSVVEAMKKISRISKLIPVLVNDPLIYQWINEKRCLTRVYKLNKDLQIKITEAEMWLQSQDQLPKVVLNYSKL